MSNRREIVVALLSLALVAIEVLWTRIFSAAFFYTFAFLVVSLAVLGLSLGALALRLAPALRREDAGPWLLLASAIGALLAPPLVLRSGLDFSKLLVDPLMAPRLALAVILLGLPFALAGAALAALFRENHARMARLYMADLVGAAVGGAAAVLAMNAIGTPHATFLAAVPLLAAGWLRGCRPRAAYLAAAGLVVTMLIFAGPLLPVRGREPGPLVWLQWDANARVKVHETGRDALNVNIDNAANTPINRFDGDLAKARREGLDGFLYRFDALLGHRPAWRFCALGAGGGGEVLQALVEDAGAIDAVEVNPTINRLMTREFADYGGRIYHDPRVTVVTADGRAYLRRKRAAYDLIVSGSSNSFAALASGAFALSENFLFTTEAFEDYLRALRPGGYLVMEHQFYIPRAVSEALIALRRAGVVHPENHVAVYNLPKLRRNVLLVGLLPLDDAARQALMGPLTAERDADVHLLWPAAEAHRDNLVAKIVANGWEREAASASFDIAPCSDDRPFVAQLGLLRNLGPKRAERLLPHEFAGFPLSRLIVLSVLAIVLVLVFPLLWLPRLVHGDRLGTAPWFTFFAIGVGFMAVEVVLMQQFTLLIGASPYTFALILVLLLLSSGLGSRVADSVPDRAPFVAIAILLGLDVLAFPLVVRWAAPAPDVVRLLVAAALIAPLGFAMGMPFPKAARKAGERVDWCFAVNGVGSVVGSAGILLIAMSFGFRVALLVAAAFYLAAGLLLQRSWVVAESRVPVEAAAAEAT